MSNFSFKDHEYAGTLKVRNDSRTGLSGDIEAENITVAQNMTVGGDLHIDGDITMASTSVVDVLSSDIYNANDPILYLNQQHTGGAVADSGLRIYRGAGNDDAILRYSDSPNEWSAGVGTNVLPLVRRHASLIDGLLPIWSASQSAVIGNADLGVFSNVLQVNLAMSVQHSGAEYAIFTHETFQQNVLRVGHRTGGTLDSNIDLGFQSTTHDGTLYSNTPAMTALGRGVFAIDTPIDDVYWLFDQCIALQRLADVSTITGYGDELRLEAIGVGKSVHLIATAINMTGPTNITGNLDVTGTLTVPSFIATSLSAEVRNYTNPAGFERLPVITGWPHTITVDNIVTSVGSQLRSNEFSYQVTIEWTGTANPGDPAVNDVFTLLCPINIYNDLAKITNIYGVIQRRATASSPIDGVRPIPAESMVIVPPYQIDPVYLTLANLAGYHILEIKTMYQLGHMTAIVTIVLRQ